jgi:hypothetical protein
MVANKRVRIFQIYYNEHTARQVEPQFIGLDNTGNERSDWAEYWPIRHALQTQTLDPNELIGFFSPRFKEKTGMNGAAVMQAIQSHDAEVYSFSPFFEQGALYLNPIFQGEAHHPGLVKLIESLLPRLGLHLDPKTFVSDQTTTVFCNYFVAKPALWMRWLGLAEQVFELSERGEGPIAEQLRAVTTHRDGSSYTSKVFVIERLISILLEAEGLAAHPCVDLKSSPRSLTNIDNVWAHMLICDALKGHYRRTRAHVYIELFAQIRKEAIDELERIEQENARVGEKSANAR